MGISLSHLILILLILVLVFGSKRIPNLMKDLAEGWKAFHKAVDKKDNKKKK